VSILFDWIERLGSLQRPIRAQRPPFLGQRCLLLNDEQAAEATMIGNLAKHNLHMRQTSMLQKRNIFSRFPRLCRQKATKKPAFSIASV
jgi:hypothetical protein